MNSYEPVITSKGTAQLLGDFLFVAGSDFYNRLNQPSQHMPFHLANHLERLDLVGYIPFYDGPPASGMAARKAGNA